MAKGPTFSIWAFTTVIIAVPFYSPSNCQRTKKPTPRPPPQKKPQNNNKKNQRMLKFKVTLETWLSLQFKSLEMRLLRLEGERIVQGHP